MNRAERFKRRQKLREEIKTNPISTKNVDIDEVNRFLNSSVDNDLIQKTKQSIDEHYTFNLDFSVSQNEAKEFLEKFKKDFNQAKFDKLISDCKQNVVQSIVTPFGLGKIISAYDKVGGNVTTVHNANQGIYADDRDKYNRKDYTNTKNSDGRQFEGASKNSVGSNFTRKKMDINGNVEDAYTGKIQKVDTTSPDHINSLSQYHKDGGFMQTNKQKANFATDENNLALTDRSINQSMRDYDKEEWKEKSNKEGVKNKDRYGIDESRLNNQIEKGKRTTQNHLPSNMEKGVYYAKNTAVSGANEGAKMGMQQAVGLIMTEFFVALFDEILDIYKNGFKNGFEDKRFFTVLKERIKNIVSKLKNKWKEVAVAFKDGFISGFISNLATTVINMFVTTGKRLVRMIREGIFSLFKAIKILLFPPEGLNFEDAMYEAKKLIATGVIVGIGVLLEEAVEKLIQNVPFLTQFGNILSTILVGSATGLAITMAIYYIDKKKNDKDAIKEMINQTEEGIENCESLLSKLSY